MPARSSRPPQSAACGRFRASMVIDYDKWRDGEPYDIAALADITPKERDALSVELCAKSTLDWRDVEALKALGTPAALARIADALEDQTDGGGAEALIAEVEANGWSGDSETMLIDKLERAMSMESSLDRLYELCEAHPTPAIRAQLLRNAQIATDPAVRYSAGAFLLYLAGHADDEHGLDKAHRPHLLDLNSDDYKVYRAAVVWLQDKVDNPVN